MSEVYDDYTTPLSCARHLMEALLSEDGFCLPDHRRTRVLEPHAGKGNFLKVVMEVRPNVTTYANEIQPKYMKCLKALGVDHLRCGDFLSMKTTKKKFDLVIGNPPFTRNAAMAHLVKGLELLTPEGSMAMLLPVFYLSSSKRFSFWKSSPLRKVWILANRPSFTGTAGTDRYDYAWYWWKNSKKATSGTKVGASLEVMTQTRD